MNGAELRSTGTGNGDNALGISGDVLSGNRSSVEHLFVRDIVLSPALLEGDVRLLALGHEAAELVARGHHVLALDHRPVRGAIII